MVRYLGFFSWFCRDLSVYPRYINMINNPLYDESCILGKPNGNVAKFNVCYLAPNELLQRADTAVLILQDGGIFDIVS